MWSGDGVAGLAKFVGEDGRGARFEVGELGVGVDVFVGVDKRGFLREERCGESE